jgi:hypothetical protein
VTIAAVCLAAGIGVLALPILLLGLHRPDSTLFAVLSSVLWLRLFVPPLLTLVGTSRANVSTRGVDSQETGIASTVDLALLALQALTILASVIVALTTKDRPAPRLTQLAGVFIVWSVSALSAVVNDAPLDSGALIVASALFGIWLLRPTIQLVLLCAGVAGIAGALLAIAMAFVLPSYAFVPPGDDNEKALDTVHGLLAGPLNNANSLGMALALTLPFTLALRGRVRVAGIAATLAAILWTSSRTSITGAIVGLVVFAVCRRSGRRISVLIVVLCGVVQVALPLAFRGQSGAFTNRGVIWDRSLDALTSAVWLGEGPNFYADQIQFGAQLGRWAFHGHNEFITLSTTGGVLAAGSAAGVLIAITVRARGADPFTRSIPYSFVATFLAVGWLETPLQPLETTSLAAWFGMAALLCCQYGATGASSKEVGQRQLMTIGTTREHR